ncbi:hypothetical protein BGZ46_006046, partial [Entomortierella lignicola]
DTKIKPRLDIGSYLSTDGRQSRRMSKNTSKPVSSISPSNQDDNMRWPNTQRHRSFRLLASLSTITTYTKLNKSL